MKHALNRDPVTKEEFDACVRLAEERGCDIYRTTEQTGFSPSSLTFMAEKMREMERRGFTIAETKFKEHSVYNDSFFVTFERKLRNVPENERDEIIRSSYSSLLDEIRGKKKTIPDTKEFMCLEWELERAEKGFYEARYALEEFLLREKGHLWADRWPFAGDYREKEDYIKRRIAQAACEGCEEIAEYYRQKMKEANEGED